MPRRSSGNDPSAEWLVWIGAVPEDERGALATLIEQADMLSIEGTIETSKCIMAAVARGALSIGVASELREWVNLVYAQLCTLKHPPDKADPSVAMLQAFFQPNTTINLNQPPKQTAYSRTGTIDADPHGKALAVDTIPGVVNE